MKKFKAVFGKKLAKNSEIEIRSDSELLVKQINAQYKILNENIQPLFLEIWNLKFDSGSVIHNLSREHRTELRRTGKTEQSFFKYRYIGK